MSSDNGVYIATFPDGYRVIHAQAIENVDYYPEGSKERKKMLKDYFGRAKVFKDYEKAKEEAFKKADEINDSDYPILEYGIQDIGGFESFG